MKLSEAIRRGCEGTYQIFHMAEDFKGGFCAAGAARLGFGKSLNDVAEFRIFDDATCPACAGNKHNWSNPVMKPACTNLIPHLNDMHRWTREEIADYVSTLEGATLVEKVGVEPVVEVQMVEEMV